MTTPKILETVTRIIEKQTKVLEHLTKIVPLYHQYDLIDDTELAEDEEEEYLAEFDRINEKHQKEEVH